MELARHVALATGQKDPSVVKSKPTTISSNYSPSCSSPRLANTLSKPTIVLSPLNTQHRSTPFSKPSTPSAITTKHLTKQEWEDRRRKGHCFGCGMKYSPQHKCSKGQLRVLLLADGEELADDGEIRLIQTDDVLDLGTAGECQVLEFCGLSSESLPTLKTIKLMGELVGIPAVILVNIGASHNFLSRKLAIALGLPITIIPPLGIRLGDGNQIHITEQCKDVSLSFGNFHCLVDALVYDLGPLDFILGIAWLGRLGDVIFNWQTQEIRFWDNDTLV